MAAKKKIIRRSIIFVNIIGYTILAWMIENVEDTMKIFIAYNVIIILLLVVNSIYMLKFQKRK